MVMVSLRLNPKEEKLFKAYADLTGKTLSELFKKALTEQIEDEFDADIANICYEDYLKNPKTYTIDEVIEDLKKDV